MDEKRTKDEFLKEIQTEWELLEALLMELDEEQMLDTRAQDGWSVKDILAHITFWERLALDRLYAARDDRPIQIELVGSWDVDGLNAQIVVELQEQGIAVVSDSVVGGKRIIHVAHTNHRTRREDFEVLVQEVVRLGKEMGGKVRKPPAEGEPSS